MRDIRVHWENLLLAAIALTSFIAVCATWYAVYTAYTESATADNATHTYVWEAHNNDNVKGD